MQKILTVNDFDININNISVYVKNSVEKSINFSKNSNNTESKMCKIKIAQMIQITKNFGVGNGNAFCTKIIVQKNQMMLLAQKINNILFI